MGRGGSLGPGESLHSLSIIGQYVVLRGSALQWLALLPRVKVARFPVCAALVFSPLPYHTVIGPSGLDQLQPSN